MHTTFLLSLPCRTLIYFQIWRRKSVFFQRCFVLFSSLYRKNATQSVPCVDSSKYLGTVIDSKLNFDKNCAERTKDAPETSLSERILLYFHKTSKMSFYWAFTTLILSLSLGVRVWKSVREEQELTSSRCEMVQ